MRAVVRSMMLLGAGLMLSACGSLLPSERAEVQSPFLDYQDAQSRFNQVDTGKTTRSQLYALGFDPLSQGNAKMLSFIDVRLMFVQPNIPIDYLPDGLITCLQAKDRCVGYAFDFSKTDSQRVGSFWADIFNFRKRREVQGWSFRPVFVLIDDVVVHKTSNGEPNIRRREDKKNPLGPLQGAGEYFSDQLK
ncbi:hypothetical protein ACYCAX_18170 [Pseudomonas sp. MT3]|uniref:hypothetical protein n=1 Tax=Pseudomonas sp. ATCC 13867 TaxID=1294143 RepID=UPI00034BC485|nr:hypothetical protein [Pseudomonas sp. ATCC 13867]RFQ41329.1 hypothetical protein D0N87_02095 [Pseudomonas sp. ATCC 13867]